MSIDYDYVFLHHYFEDEKPEIILPRKLSDSGNSTESEENKKNNDTNEKNINQIKSIDENKESLNLEENVKHHKKVYNFRRRVSFDDKFVKIINVEKWKKYNEDVSLKNPLYIELLNKRKESWDNCLIF